MHAAPITKYHALPIRLDERDGQLLIGKEWEVFAYKGMATDVPRAGKILDEAHRLLKSPS